MNNNSKKLLLVLVVLVFLYIGELSYMQVKNTIITVDGRRITKAQYDETFEKNANISGFLSFGIDIKAEKNKFIYALIKDKTINDVIRQTLIDEEIDKKNITASRKEINNKLQSVMDKVGSQAVFYNTLKENEMSIYAYKKQLGEEIKKDKLAKSISDISVSDAEAKKYYNENLSNYAYPEKVRLSHIFITADPAEIKQTIKADPKNASLTDKQIQAKVDEELAARLKKINVLLSKVKKAPNSFAEIAVTNSNDERSAKQGGDLGFMARHQMAAPISKVVFSLEPNKVSGIIMAPHGYHIVVVTGKIKAGYEPFDKVKNDIVNTLENNKRDAVLDNLVQSLQKKAKIVYVNPEYAPKQSPDKK